jgi:hypothetical protein
MDFQVQDRELLGDTTWVELRPDTSPLMDQYRAGNIKTTAAVLQGDAQIELVDNRALGDTVRINAANPAQTQFYTLYFPGWYATIDGSPVPVEPLGEQGLLTLNVPAGAHTVTTHWGTTLQRVIGGSISLISTLAALLVIWRTRNL